MNTRKKSRLPNPPRSTKLTKKLATEAMRVIDTVYWSLFVTGVLERPALHIDQKWLQELHDRVVDCSAGLHKWYGAEKDKKRKKAKNREAAGENHVCAE